MYKLYFSKGACSLATQIIMRELNLNFQLVESAGVEGFLGVNPVGAVPVVEMNGSYVTEGAAIILHLLQSHPEEEFSKKFSADDKAVQNMMFANATMHPAYGRLFFLAPRLEDGPVKSKLIADSAAEISRLWSIVEGMIGEGGYLGQDSVSAADILLAVYSSWGQHFPVDIAIGPKASEMIARVQSLESYSLSTLAESEPLAEVCEA